MSELTKIAVAVARIDEGVEHLNEKVDALSEVSERRLDNHAGRVRSLELSRSRFKGAGAAIGSLIATVGSVIAYIKMK